MRAAREVFSELGYDAATFQAIAIRADLTRPAINHYFASKRILYREVVQQTNAMVVAAGLARAQAETSLLGRLSAFFAAAMQADSQDRSAAAFLVTAVLESQRHPELPFLFAFDLKNPRLCWVAVSGRAQFGCECGFGAAGHAARALILTRLWARTPCPVQIRVPSVPSMRERSQP